jgi:hypothetical protein
MPITLTLSRAESSLTPAQISACCDKKITVICVIRNDTILMAGQLTRVTDRSYELRDDMSNTFMLVDTDHLNNIGLFTTSTEFL